jgi:hypothetical protein
MIVDELMRHESPDNPSALSCFQCGQGCEEGSYRCKDCADPVILCSLCMVKTHQANFLHCIEVRTSPALPVTLALSIPALDRIILSASHPSISGPSGTAGTWARPHMSESSPLVQQ